MLLRNFYNALAYLMIGSKSIGSTSDFCEGILYMKKLDGTISAPSSVITNSYTNYWFPMSDMVSSGTSYLYGNIMFGTGNTPVTFDDYKLTDYKYFSANGSCTTDGVTYDDETKTFSNIFRCNFTNSTGADMTIREIGITAVRNVLYYREVLETPFTVPAGKTITFTHEFKFTMPM